MKTVLWHLKAKRKVHRDKKAVLYWYKHFIDLETWEMLRCWALNNQLVFCLVIQPNIPEPILQQENTQS